MKKTALAPAFSSLVAHRSRGPRAATVIALAWSLLSAACSDENGTLVPGGSGGPGSTLTAADGAVASGSDAGTPGQITRMDASAKDASSGAGGSSVSGGAGVSGNSGVGGAAGGVAAGGSGGAVAVDACAACAQAKCLIAQPNAVVKKTLTSYLNAYKLCFGSGVWAGDPNFCPSDVSMAATTSTATAGPASGKKNTDLCQAALQCLRSSPSHCYESGGLTACYCGTVDVGTCFSSGGAQQPNGDCKAELEDAAESLDQATLGDDLNNTCLPAGSADKVYLGCYETCCPTECGSTASPQAADVATYCVSGAGGVGSGGGGSGGTGLAGAGGAGGMAGAGAAGSGGTAGTGGIAGNAVGMGGSGGTPAAGGIAGGGVDAGAGGMVTGGSGGSGGSATGGAGTGGVGGVATGDAGGAIVSLLINPNFDLGTNPWVLNGSNATLMFNSGQDAHGNAQSGSLDLALSMGNTTLSTEVAATQCFKVSSGDTYKVSADVSIPGNTSSRGGAEFWYFGSTDCLGSIVSVEISPQSSAATWQSVTMTAQVPANTQSVAVRLVVVKPDGQTQAEALFDDVVLSRQ